MTVDRLAAFLDRRFRCHRCGRSGRQTRESDPTPSTMRFAAHDGSLLLPRCDRCSSAHGLGRWRVTERALLRAVSRRGPAGSPGLDPVPLPVLQCSVRECSLLWHELSTPPLPGFLDPEVGLVCHPCPWCLETSFDHGVDAHFARARGLRPPAA